MQIWNIWFMFICFEPAPWSVHLLFPTSSTARKDPSITKRWADLCNSIMMFVGLPSITFLKSFKSLFGFFVPAEHLCCIFINLSKICFFSGNSSIKFHHCALCTFKVFFSLVHLSAPKSYRFNAFSINIVRTFSVSNQFLFWLPD